MKKEQLKEKLLQNLGQNYESAIDEMIANITNFRDDQYYTHEILVKRIKEKNDLIRMIEKENIQQYVKTDRGHGIKEHPIHVNLKRAERDIAKYSKQLTIKSNRDKKDKDKKDEYAFMYEDEPPVIDDFESEEEYRLADLIWRLHHNDSDRLHKNRFFERIKGQIRLCFNNYTEEREKTSRELEDIICSGIEPLFDWEGKQTTINTVKPQLEYEDLQRLREKMKKYEKK